MAGIAELEMSVHIEFCFSDCNICSTTYYCMPHHHRGASKIVTVQIVFTDSKVAAPALLLSPLFSHVLPGERLRPFAQFQSLVIALLYALSAEV